MTLAWQSSLFGSTTPRPDASFDGCQRRLLERGAWLDHQPGWLDGHDSLMAELVESAAWKQRSRRMYEQEVDEPRLTAWVWGKHHDFTPPPVVEDIRTLLSARYAVEFDS